MTMPNPSDLRQSLLAFFMILFFCSSMSLVWTFTTIVPFYKGSYYQTDNCSLIAVRGVPQVCEGHQYFSDLDLKNGSACSDKTLCSQVLEEQNCIQFYVKSSKGLHVLHEDEIDITGMCVEQTHCSVQRKFNERCDKHLDCTTSGIVAKARKFFDQDILKMDTKSPCLINPDGGVRTGAIIRRQMPTFFRTSAFHAVFWPCSGFTFSTISCSIFWWKNRNHVLKFTQSG